MAVDCSNGDSSWKANCQAIVKGLGEANNRVDDLQTQIWIVSGVCGGVALILIIIVIALAIWLSSLRQQAIYFNGNSKAKRKPTLDRGNVTQPSNNGESTHLRHPPHSFAQPPPKNLTSEEELAQLGYSAYTGQEQRGMSTSPAVNSSGGVRVLPRNPPTGFRNTAAYNEGYM